MEWSLSSSSDGSGAFDDYWRFTEDQIRRSGHKYSRETIGGEPGASFLYGVLCSVKDGVESRAELYEHLKGVFASRLNQSDITEADVDQAIQDCINKDLLVEKDEVIQLTSEGEKVVEGSRLHVLHAGYYIKKFLNEKLVVVISAIFLLGLSASKIWVGLSIGSGGMFNEGIENLTDLVKVRIVFFSVRFQQDRLGAILIAVTMLITGFTLGVEGFNSFFAGEEVVVTVEAFYVSAVSFVLNYMLVALKVVISRTTGNLALLSDAKDNENHIKITAGVVIGLSFSVFGYYFMDSVVAIFIAGLVLYDAVVTLKELVGEEESIDINTIHLSMSNYLEDTVTTWMLSQLARGPVSQSQLEERFQRGVQVGYRYYDVFATFGFHSLQQRGIGPTIQQGRKVGLIQEVGDKLQITTLGFAAYYKARAKEFEAKYDVARARDPRIRPLIAFIVIFVFFFLIMFYSDTINMFIASLRP